MVSETQINIPVSIGELFDKITILELKLRHVRSDAVRANIEKEHNALLGVLRENGLAARGDLSQTAKALFETNEKLWEVEDRLRELEHARDFGERFVQYARSVYVLNDQRAAIKKNINQLSGSAIVEEKLYAQY